MLQTKLVNAVEREKKIGKEYTFMSNMDGKIFRWPSIRELARIAHCKKKERERWRRANKIGNGNGKWVERRNGINVFECKNK